MNQEFTLSQRRALAVFTVIALAFGAFFLRGYFVLIVVAAVGAYLFTPLFRALERRMPTGLAATGTLLAALVAVIVPVGLSIFLAVAQITRTAGDVAQWVQATDPTTLGDKALKFANGLLARIPFVHVELTMDWVREAMVNVAQKGGELLLHVLQGAVGGAVGAVTSAIIFLYVFLAMLTNREELQTLIRRLNPLGAEVTDLYLAKMGSMVRGTVGGQFVIAFCQGVAGAASIYIAGFHQAFFVFAILLTALSIIPLGGGIVTIPFGIGMALFGNVAGGVFVVAFHLIVVTNIDNFLRPILVPRDARLNSALMLLAVFAGIGMFGFWGVVIGPVLMIIIVTTIDVYLAVYHGVPLDSPQEESEEPAEPKPRRWSGLRRVFSR
ncbi:AI-2E family transporter [[Mycobacterium] vasticus]|uniref:AI-2E family transporter n=1 Tax=[Mycobacterium] vasticus TaxID=2875777 RepID=A0ABU5YY49_9MYCO|nr:AI-2E family transporter [Mycolicibacter sp. MYC017]MEB3068653.1 AI-2E family transporter [Mycolicibacter sp. MYC017]